MSNETFFLMFTVVSIAIFPFAPASAIGLMVGNVIGYMFFGRKR